MTGLYIKWLKTGRVGPYSGEQWPDPRYWLTVDGPLEACRNGIHVCGLYESFEWMSDEAWLAEVDETDGFWHKPSKFVCRRARLVEQLPWNERTARLFAADCAKHVLHFFEDKRPRDDRPRKAIAAARDYAEGRITAAARAAAWDAAQAAERQWQAEQLADVLGLESV